MSSEIDPEELRALLGVLPAVVVLVGADCRIRYVNRAAEGCEVRDLIGRDYLDFVEPSHREALVINAGEKPEWYESLVTHATCPHCEEKIGVGQTRGAG